MPVFKDGEEPFHKIIGIQIAAKRRAIAVDDDGLTVKTILDEIADGVIFSSSVIENAKTRVGKGAMIQAGTTFSKDVPPFIIAGGHPLHYKSPNKTMMTANNVDEKVQKHVANAYRLVFHGQTSVFDACLQIKDQVPDGKEIRIIIDFLKSTKAGIIGKM